MTRKSSKHPHATYGILNNCFDLIGSHHADAWHLFGKSWSLGWSCPLKGKNVLSRYIWSCDCALLYGCTTWPLTKRLEKKLDDNYTRMLQAILNKSWRQHPTTHQLYGHLPPITKTIQVRRTRHAGHCWRSRDDLISDVLLWTPTHGRVKAGRLERTHIEQLCEDTGCCPEDLPEAMNDKEKLRERVRDIRASSMTWWWWCLAWIGGSLVEVRFLHSGIAGSISRVEILVCTADETH